MNILFCKCLFNNIHVNVRLYTFINTYVYILTSLFNLNLKCYENNVFIYKVHIYIIISLISIFNIYVYSNTYEIGLKMKEYINLRFSFINYYTTKDQIDIIFHIVTLIKRHIQNFRQICKIGSVLESKH